MQLTKIESLILGSLSFYEPMTFSRIILDLNNTDLEELPHFAKEDLEITLETLVKKKLVKTQKLDKEIAWIRIHPKRKWWKIIFPL